MRLQLDSAATQMDITRSNEASQAAPAGGSVYDSRRAGSSAAGADSIGISGPSSALRAMSAERAARIQQLTAQVRAGTYDVPGSSISEAMVAHASSWSGSGAE